MFVCGLRTKGLTHFSVKNGLYACSYSWDDFTPMQPGAYYGAILKQCNLDFILLFLF